MSLGKVLEVWPVVLLCGIAVVQMGMLRFANLSPWKGGGFGMFSTVDEPASRQILVWLETTDGLMAGQIPPEEETAAARLRTWPTRGRVEDLERRLWGYSWMASVEDLERAKPVAVTGEFPPQVASPVVLDAQPWEAAVPGARKRFKVKNIRVEVRRIVYDPVARKVSTEAMPL